MTEKKRSLFLGAPFTFTKYDISPEKIAIQSGLLSRSEKEVFLYKIVDVRLERGLAERLFGLGTVVCYEGKEKRVSLEHVKNAKEIKAFIIRQAEEERQRRLSVLVV